MQPKGAIVPDSIWGKNIKTMNMLEMPDSTLQQDPGCEQEGIVMTWALSSGLFITLRHVHTARWCVASLLLTLTALP